MALPVVEEECPECPNVKNHTNLFCVKISRLGKFFFFFTIWNYFRVQVWEVQGNIGLVNYQWPFNGILLILSTSYCILSITLFWCKFGISKILNFLGQHLFVKYYVCVKEITF